MSYLLINKMPVKKKKIEKKAKQVAERVIKVHVKTIAKTVLLKTSTGIKVSLDIAPDMIAIHPSVCEEFKFKNKNTQETINKWKDIILMMGIAVDMAEKELKK